MQEEYEVIEESQAQDRQWGKLLYMSFQLSWSLRLVGFCFSLLVILLSLFWIPFLLLCEFLNIIFCASFRSWHRFVRGMWRRWRWWSVLGFTSLFMSVSPSFGLIFLVSYCTAKSYDIPHNWLKLLWRLDLRNMGFDR